MIVLQTLVWAVLAYAFWRALKAGWDAWLASFGGITGDAPAPTPRLITPSGGGQVSRAGRSPRPWPLPPARPGEK